MNDFATLARIDRLEAENTIRKIVARYFRICDQLGPDTLPSELGELGELFDPDAIWEGKGRYAEAFGTMKGRAAIVEMIRGYCGPEPHFAMTAHFCTSEDIAVDGDQASGSWMMLQATTYADGRADLRSARLQIEFARERRVWRIRRFTTENIFSRRVDHWNDAATIPVPIDSHAGAAR
ncbi:MAG: nuclear transport factor 2 family protein [Pseudomonadota bacterium]|uniref:nuclear transport factor 2 family protein n=1 Tax=Sphingomonas sp. ERG5 TaxID=1381597 RepID=UPI00054B2874|nr:nuclear transport factor 2 family protein [Sphingomonas sp. ERG5]